MWQRYWEPSFVNYVYTILGPERQAAFETLSDEVNAIKDAYEKNKEDIPRATQQRLEKRIAAFRQEWQGVEPKMPLKDWKTLDEKDHLKQFESFRDLTKSHNIIEAHYGHPENVPEASNKVMAQEVKEYYQEIDTYQNDDAFKKQLEAMRERQKQQQLKPKMH